MNQRKLVARWFLSFACATLIACNGGSGDSGTGSGGGSETGGSNGSGGTSETGGTTGSGGSVSTGGSSASGGQRTRQPAGRGGAAGSGQTGNRRRRRQGTGGAGGKATGGAIRHWRHEHWWRDGHGGPRSADAAAPSLLARRSAPSPIR